MQLVGISDRFNKSRLTHKQFEIVAMMIKPIKTEEDYRIALKQIEGLMNAEADTQEGDLLDILVTLVEEYERKAYPLE